MPSCSCGHDGSLGILQGGCKSFFFVSEVPAGLAKDFFPREKIFKAWKPNRLRREIGLVSAQWPRRTYAKAYLSRLALDISAQLFPSHWEFDFCVFAVQHTSQYQMCYHRSLNLPSICIYSSLSYIMKLYGAINHNISNTSNIQPRRASSQYNHTPSAITQSVT
jgi:hypothetical protein